LFFARMVRAFSKTKYPPPLRRNDGPSPRRRRDKDTRFPQRGETRFADAASETHPREGGGNGSSPAKPGTFVACFSLQKQEHATYDQHHPPS
jgi:hypothetical protein